MCWCYVCRQIAYISNAFHLCSNASGRALAFIHTADARTMNSVSGYRTGECRIYIDIPHQIIIHFRLSEKAHITYINFNRLVSVINNDIFLRVLGPGLHLIRHFAYGRRISSQLQCRTCLCGNIHYAFVKWASDEVVADSFHAKIWFGMPVKARANRRRRRERQKKKKTKQGAIFDLSLWRVELEKVFLPMLSIDCCMSVVRKYNTYVHA